MSEPMPSIPTQSTFTYPDPNPSASPSFTLDDTSESFIPEPTQPMPTFTQTAFSQPTFSQPAFSQPNQSISRTTCYFFCIGKEQSKELGKDAKGNTLFKPPVSLDEHVVVQRSIKLRLVEMEELDLKVANGNAFLEDITDL
ncbi:hypothetical protein Tco_1492314 [Tanacetum coccineum]